jgi:hypothetical protein
MLTSATAALWLFAVLGSTAPASAAFVHGGGFHGGGSHGGGFHGFHGGGFRGFGGFHGGGFHAFHGGFRGFHGGFARGVGGGHFHALMAGRHWNYYHSNGRFGTGWGRHGGFAAARFMPVPHGFAGGLGRNWSGRRFGGNRAVWAGYGGYGGYGGWSGYYTDYDGLWGGDIVGLGGLAAGISLGAESGDCLIYTPVYDNLGQYLGVEPVDLCSM